MATVMEFQTPAGEFPLGSVFESQPEATVELERLVPQDTLVIPYFWVRGASVEDIEESFDAHPGVSDVRLVDSVEGEYLMRGRWDREYVGVLRAIEETDLVMLSAVGTAEGWSFEVRSESHEEIGAFRRFCQAEQISIEVTGVHALLAMEGTGYELTDSQREALLAAYEHGYFDSPRACSLADVAEEIGITQQSLSARLRRGHRQLIAATLVAQ